MPPIGVEGRAHEIDEQMYYADKKKKLCKHDLDVCKKINSGKFSLIFLYLLSDNY